MHLTTFKTPKIVVMAVELKYGGRAGMAVPLFKELADEGDAKSMVELANCYDEGLGV